MAERSRLDSDATIAAVPYDYDPVTSFMDLSLYRHQSAIEEWMQHSRSNGEPAFDEDSEFSDTPVPSQMFTDIGRAHGDDEDVHGWAEKVVGDTHLGKRKTKIGPEQRKGKRTRTDDEEDIGSGDTTPEPSGGSGNGGGDSSTSDGGGGDDSDGEDSDGNDGDAGGGGDGGQGSGSGWQHGRMSPFTGEEDFTHATQDRDHGAPSSQRLTTSAHRRGRQALLAYDEDTSSSASSGQQYYNPYSTSPPGGGFLWPPPGTVNLDVPRSLPAMPYLELHGYLPYGAPHYPVHGQPPYLYLPPPGEPYEGPPGERYEE